MKNMRTVMLQAPFGGSKEKPVTNFFWGIVAEPNTDV